MQRVSECTRAVAARKRSGCLKVIFRSRPPATRRRHSRITSSSTGEHAAVEPGPQALIEPCLKVVPKHRVGLPLDAVADLRQGDRTQEQAVSSLPIRPCLHVVIGLSLAQLRHHVGVEQPSAQRSTSRTGLRTESPPNTRRASGDRDRRSCRLVAASRARRRSNSSAATTTTACLRGPSRVAADRQPPAGPPGSTVPWPRPTSRPAPTSSRAEHPAVRAHLRPS